jgi:hypothetical protein
MFCAPLPQTSKGKHSTWRPHVGQEGHTGLLGCVLTGLSPEHVSCKSARRRGIFESFYLKSRIDQCVALRILPDGSYREPKVSVVVLLDKKRAKLCINHGMTLRAVIRERYAYWPQLLRRYDHRKQPIKVQLQFLNGRVFGVFR